MCLSPIALPSAEPPADETNCPSVYLPALPPGCLTHWSHVEACWRPNPADGLTPLTPRWRPHPADGLTPICCGCRSCGGELGSAWVAGQHTGPPWLAPVILPSHSSATDINNNSTSGFTLLSRVNPFHCSTDCYCGWPSPKPPSQLKSHCSCCQSSFLCLIYCCTVSFFSFHREPAISPFMCAFFPE